MRDDSLGLEFICFQALVLFNVHPAEARGGAQGCEVKDVIGFLPETGEQGEGRKDRRRFR